MRLKNREMKNYTEIGKKILSEKIQNIEYESDGIKIKTLKINKLEGEVYYYQFLAYYINIKKTQAEINIRKGKQYLIYEFNIEV